MSLNLYEIGEKCSSHPESALAVSPVQYRYYCSECKRIDDNKEEMVTTA